MASSPARRGDGGPLKVNDPVHVEREGKHLEGVVAFLGKVSFADGDDWVGVRLTGASVGMGKNDGSVKGTKYFACGPNCGVFVRKSHISRRTLSRLEELRLRRELAKSGGGGSPTSSKSRTATTPPRLTSTSSTSPTSSSARSRLEELRKRREEAQQGSKSAEPRSKPTSSVSPKRPTTSSAALSKSDDKTEVLQAKISSLETELEGTKNQLSSKEEENDSLQKSLLAAQQAADEARSEAKSAKEAMDALQEAKEAAKKEDKSVMSLEDAKEALELAQEQVFHLNAERDDLEERLSKSEAETRTLKNDLNQEREGRQADAVELTEAKASASALELELQALNEQANVRGAADSSHYKEKAILQAELGGVKRRVQELETEKQDMETTIEELTLDKEQLQEEKDVLEDKIEEMKIDTETAQMEVEELRLELEDAKATSEAPAADSAPIAAESGSGADAEDVAQALSVQNGRLREALIRLREQSAVEKMDLSRELRAAEKDAAAGKELTEELETLRLVRSKLEEEIGDLKDMVEQGSAFETMVEDLSDRVMVLEDDNVALQSTIRELEEAADITAEMEEVQAEEAKALMRDVEDRDTVVRNLEEAIRMQRRREEDFQRTVGNYRTSVETLKQEKSALLELQKGGEGEKSEMLASTQKALARASQLVADGANIRKREAEAAIDRIESHVLRHMSDRLESLMPQSVVSSELASVKGELLLSKVVEKASRSLNGISTIFTKKIRLGTSETLSSADKAENVDPDMSLALSDEASQAVGNMIHQSTFALVTADIAADMLRLLSAGQWPDLLSPEASAELGSLVGHSISDVDVALGDLLRTLKEEGVLSPHQTNLGSFEQSIRSTMEDLNTAIDSDGNLLLPSEWKPPGWQLFKDVSIAKFSCLGAGAAVASAVGTEDSGETSSDETRRLLGPLMTKLDQVCAEASKASIRLTRLNVNDENVVASIGEPAAFWKEASSKLLESVKTLFSSEETLKVSNVTVCESAADEVLKLLVPVSTSLRSANLNNEDSGAFHPLSPEADDPWEGVSSLSQALRSIDGDGEDVNFLVRSRAIELKLSDAVANEPKLSLANAKVSSLEKSLSSRSKEIAIQNARLSELEKLLARKSSGPSPTKKSVEQSSTEEMNKVKEENRVLTEAMDVLQRQVDEYEKEIRFFKDSKSPRAGGRRNMYMGKRSVSSVTEYSTDARRGRFDLQPPSDAMSTANVAAMETALYRPALQSARHEAAVWKSKAFVSSLMNLPPLNVPGVPHSSMEEEKSQEPEDEGTRCLQQLSAARSYSRLAKASMSIVNLKDCRPERNSRALLRDALAKPASAEKRLEEAAACATRWLSKVDSPSHGEIGKTPGSKLVGRINVPGADGPGVIPVTVRSGDLYRMHLHLFQ